MAPRRWFLVLVLAIGLGCTVPSAATTRYVQENTIIHEQLIALIQALRAKVYMYTLIQARRPQDLDIRRYVQGLHEELGRNERTLRIFVGGRAIRTR